MSKDFSARGRRGKKSHYLPAVHCHCLTVYRQGISPRGYCIRAALANWDPLQQQQQQQKKWTLGSQFLKYFMMP